MFDKNKLHLVPPIIQDLAKNILSEHVNINERSNYVGRLEAIAAYCSHVIQQFEQQTRLKPRK